MSDGPHGLRKQAEGGDNGVSYSEPATSFPTAATTASSFNPDNTYKMGQAIAEECRHYGVHVLLGPGVNIKRNPLCGRNFEYFSEDPLLAADIAADSAVLLKNDNVLPLSRETKLAVMGDMFKHMRYQGSGSSMINPMCLTQPSEAFAERKISLCEEPSSILYNAVISVANKQMKEAQKLPDGIEKENKIKGALFLKRILDTNSLRTMSMCGGKNFPLNFAKGFAEMSNGNIIRGIKFFIQPIKVPELPKNQQKTAGPENP